MLQPDTLISSQTHTRLKEPRHEGAQVAGQRDGCRYEKEQASHDLTAIQHCCSTSLVTSLCLVLAKNYQGYSEGSGSLTYYPYPHPQVPLPITLKGYPYPCYCLVNLKNLTFNFMRHQMCQGVSILPAAPCNHLKVINQSE